MPVVAPDFARRIDLPGVGPCPRPVDIDRSTTGFAALVSLRIYSFARDMVIDGEAEDDEVFIVAMRGAADIAVASAGIQVGTFALRDDHGSRVVYLPPHAAYRLTASADCDIAYARARPSAASPGAAGFAATGDRLEIADHADGMELMLATLPVGATLDLVASDAGSPERFVHVRSEDGIATIGGETLKNWDSAILGDGAVAALTAANGSIDVLLVSARAQRNGASKAANDER